MLHGGSREHLTRFGTRRDLRGGGFDYVRYIHCPVGSLWSFLATSSSFRKCSVFCSHFLKSPDNDGHRLALSTARDYHNRTLMIQSESFMTRRMGKIGVRFKQIDVVEASGDNVGDCFLHFLSCINCCSVK